MSGSWSQQRREYLFNLYLDNLRNLHSLAGYPPEILKLETIICPMCLKTFDRSALGLKQLTLDHVPAEALGGRDNETILICSACNSDSGGTTDIAAIEFVRLADFNDMISGTSLDAKFSIAEFPGFKMNVKIGDEKSVHVYVDKNRMDPAIYRMQMEYLHSLVGQQNPDLTGRFQYENSKLHVHTIQVAWLRYAYLTYFRHFGYTGILHEALNMVREQIQRPHDQLLPAAWLLHFGRGRDGTLPMGVSLVQRPEELRGILVGLEVNIESNSRQIYTLLPIYTHDAKKFYEKLKDAKPEVNCDVDVLHVLESLEFWEKPEVSHHFLSSN